MAQATGKKSERWAVGPHLQRGLREGALYLSLALSAFLFLSLATFHSADPGWSHMGSNSEIANLGGRFGAWLSDVVLYVFGLMAFVFPLMVGYAGWLYFRGIRDEEESPSRLHTILRSLGFVLTMAGGAALAFIHHGQRDVGLSETGSRRIRACP